MKAKRKQRLHQERRRGYHKTRRRCINRYVRLLLRGGIGLRVGDVSRIGWYGALDLVERKRQEKVAMRFLGFWKKLKAENKNEN